VRRESLTPPAYEAAVVAGTSFAPPHGLASCGPGVRAQLVPRVGIAQSLPPPAARIAMRQGKEIECLLVVTSAADSVVKRGVRPSQLARSFEPATSARQASSDGKSG
jgi:hypothetical protein